MKILLVFICLLGLSNSMYANSPLDPVVGKNSGKKNHHVTPKVQLTKMDPCTVTVEQTGFGFVANCDGSVTRVNCGNSCTKSGADCTTAYNQARPCAQSAVARCLASILQPACP